jgi:hypothetical protein
MACYLQCKMPHERDWYTIACCPIQDDDIAAGILCARLRALLMLGGADPRESFRVVPDKVLFSRTSARPPRPRAS